MVSSNNRLENAQQSGEKPEKRERYPISKPEVKKQHQAGLLHNIYLPEQAVVDNIIRENELVNTYELHLVDELTNHHFSYQPGQFMMISMPHLGEAPISFSSSPDSKDGFALTIRKSGRLTDAVHGLQKGDTIGVRGPYGRPFPLEPLRGRNLLFIAGGIGLAPLRPVIEYCLSRSEEFGRIVLLYGSRTEEDFCFSRDFPRWKQSGIDCFLTVDRATGDWQGPVGLVTGLLENITVQKDDIALVCGPGIMIRFVLKQLLAMGLEPANILTTLERHMKCGVGICGHCHMEHQLVCLDGPVFTAEEIPDPENP